ncbi:MAG TPA: LamG domain-containing protein [Anaerohalosphaeraceae bacterium]|nr:LamG domain-containing protein [Anaerohalosphaeraceae bacterium]
MKTRKTLFCFVIAASLLLAAPGWAVNLISMNFAENTNQVFAGGQLIGPLKTNSSYWNNTGANIPTGTMNDLMDKYGKPTTADVSWKSKNCWYNGDGTGSDEAKLAVGYLDDGDDGPSFTVTSIPFAAYNAYILFTSDQNGNYTHGSLTVNGTVVLGGPFPAHGRVTDGTGWVESDGTVYGNYIKVPNLSGNLTVSTVKDAGRAPLTAFIIEEIPSSVYVDNFSPALGAARVGQDVQLSWDVFNATGTPSFNVYLSSNPKEVDPSIDPNIPTVPTATTGDTSYIPPSPLEPGTLYYWRIDAADDANTVPIMGNILTFSTGGDVTGLYPADGATGAATDLTISWTGDAAGSTYIDAYAVYFGETLPATPTATVTETQWQPAALSDGTTYQCKIVSQHQGAPVSETTISFTTGALIGYWPFDDALTDTVGSNDGTRANPHFAGGVIGSGAAAEFFGDEPITLPIPDIATGGNWTISFWDYSDPLIGGGWETILGNGAGPDGWEIFEFGRYNFNRYIFGIDNTYIATPNDSSYLRGGWQCHTITYDSAAKIVTWYINGTKRTDYPGKTISLYEKLSVGNVSGGSQPFTGRVDDFKVYSRPLSAGQVLQAFIDDLAGKPYNPNPASGTMNLFWDPVLTWRFAEAPDSAVLEIGTKPDLSDATPIALTGNLESFDVYAGLGIHLAPSTGYYWRVTPTYAETPVAGPIWYFVVRDLITDLNNDLAVNNADLLQVADKWLEDTTASLTAPWAYLDQDYWNPAGDPNVVKYAVPWGGDGTTWAVGTVKLQAPATPNLDPAVLFDPNDQTLVWSYDTSKGGWAIGITITLPQTVDFSKFDKFGYWVYQRNCTSTADIRIDDEKGGSYNIYRDWYDMSSYNNQWHKYEWDIPAGAASAVYQIRLYRGTINPSALSSEEFGDFFLVKNDQTVKLCLPIHLTNAEDINQDCKVNLIDLSILAQDWLLDASN